MHTIDSWSPQKLIEHGNQHISIANDLLATRGVNLSQRRRDVAQDWLTQ